MAANVPLLTTASRLSATQNVDNYAEGVAVHINADWAAHYQIEIINENWVDACGNVIVGSSRLRLPLTVDGVALDVVVPIVPFLNPSAGDAPAITAQPVNTNVSEGATAQLFMAATGAPHLTYQWLKNGVALPGATSAQLVLSNVDPSVTGTYVCVVANGFGSLSSDPAVLTVTRIIGPGHFHSTSSSFWDDVTGFFKSQIGI